MNARPLIINELMVSCHVEPKPLQTRFHGRGNVIKYRPEVMGQHCKGHFPSEESKGFRGPRLYSNFLETGHGNCYDVLVSLRGVLWMCLAQQDRSEVTRFFS